MKQFVSITSIGNRKNDATSCSWGTHGAAAALTVLGTALLIRKISSKTMSSSRQLHRAMNAKPFDPTSEAGVLEPLGYWDPVGLMSGWREGEQWKNEETFRQYRMAELKHGRVAMMALAGIAVQTQYRLPGEFEFVPNGWAALSTPAGGGGLGILVLVAGFFELAYWKQDPSKAPGDFGDPLGLWESLISKASVGADIKDLRTREINNGRLAMSLSISGLIVEYFTGFSPETQLEKIGEFAQSPTFFTGLALLLLSVMATYKDDTPEYSPVVPSPVTAIKPDSSSINTVSKPEALPIEKKVGLITKDGTVTFVSRFNDQPEEGMCSGRGGYKTCRDKAVEAGRRDGWNGAAAVTRIMKRD
jgi:hypothetical protein